jgi:hypothetical protein
LMLGPAGRRHTGCAKGGCGYSWCGATTKEGFMSRRYFGTDGIRGLANSAPMTSEIALKVGMAAGKLFSSGAHRHRVVIGKDTRLSGYMIESALMSGFTAVGMDVFLLGPMPTPAVAMLTRSLRADLGVMISASHNPYADNGIKLFDPDGYKLSDEAEGQIEALMEAPAAELLAPAERIGRRSGTSSLPSARWPATSGSTICASSSTAPMAPATRWRPTPCGSWAPRWSRSASSPTATTST